jgi:hypothetical protein
MTAATLIGSLVIPVFFVLLEGGAERLWRRWRAAVRSRRSALAPTEPRGD